jgi:hypothetical protein
MPLGRFEPMTSVFERAKTVHALDRAATVIGFEVLVELILILTSVRIFGRGFKEF